MIPQTQEEFREGVLQFLHQMVFHVDVQIYLGTTETPIFWDHRFGYVHTRNVRLLSADFTEVCNDLANEIGVDVYRASKMGVREYHFWIHRIPSHTYNATHPVTFELFPQVLMSRAKIFV